MNPQSRCSYYFCRIAIPFAYDMRDPETSSNPVFDDAAFKINCLSAREWRLASNHVAQAQRILEPLPSAASRLWMTRPARVTTGRFGLSVFVQFSTNIRRHHTNLLHGVFQYFRRYSKLFGPVANLMVLMNVDSVAVPIILDVRIVRHAVRSQFDGKADGSGNVNRSSIHTSCG